MEVGLRSAIASEFHSAQRGGEKEKYTFALPSVGYKHFVWLLWGPRGPNGGQSNSLSPYLPPTRSLYPHNQTKELGESGKLGTESLEAKCCPHRRRVLVAACKVVMTGGLNCCHSHKPSCSTASRAHALICSTTCASGISSSVLVVLFIWMPWRVYRKSCVAW